MTGSPRARKRALPRYQRLAQLAMSASARVELCRLTTGDRSGTLVALKRLRTDATRDPAFLAMFRDEMWLTGSLKHEHVVEVIDWGEDEAGPFLAMEFVNGVSLARLLRTVVTTGEQFPERLVVYLGACAARGLSAAHQLVDEDGASLNLVHRDLTPANVLVGFDGEVKVGDFGLAKARRRLTETVTGVLKGDPGYMAPEQIRGAEVDARADLFSLGVVLFELLTHRRPWTGTGDVGRLRATLERPPIPVESLRPKMESNLASWIMRCLAKDPAARFEGAAEVADQLSEWLELRGYHDSREHLGRFVRRNAMRQMRWIERALAQQPIDNTIEEGEGPTLIRRPKKAGRPKTSTTLQQAAAARDTLPTMPAAPKDVVITTVPHDPDDVGDDDDPPTNVAWGEDAPIVESESAPSAITRPRIIPRPVPAPPQTPQPPKASAPKGAAPKGAAAKGAAAKGRASKGAAPKGAAPKTRAKAAAPVSTAPKTIPRNTPAPKAADLERLARELAGQADTLSKKAARAATEALDAAQQAEVAAAVAREAAEGAELAAKAAARAAEAVEAAAKGDANAAKERAADARALGKRAGSPRPSDGS